MMQHINLLASKNILIPLSAIIICVAIWSKSDLLTDLEENSEYDFIIVGAGTSGCVLASKLSENPKNKVLLIEAGHQFTYFSKIPLLATALQGTKYDWSFKTVPQKYSSFGLENRVQFLPRGKGLGGSGMINYLIHGEAVPKDFDNWGIPGWDYESIFQNQSNQNFSQESCEPSDFCQKDQYEKEDSSLKLSSSNCELTDYLSKAVNEIGKKNPEIKFEHTYLTTDQGQRWTSFDRFLKPILNRKNLNVILNTKVLKVLIVNKRAVGLQVNQNGKNLTTYSKRDVILAAGAFHTPQILLLSGIGDKTQLEKLNIPVVTDLPGVGQNLHDHLNMPLYVSIDRSKSVTLDKILSLREIWNYLFYGTGVFSSTPMAGSMKGPDSINILLFAMGSADEKILREIANYKEETFRSLFPLYKNSSQEGFVLLSSCLQPKSRGSVYLNSSDPNKMPVVDPNYLSRKEDIECIIKAISYAKKLMETSVFRGLGARIHWPKLKNCQNWPVDSTNNEYLECIIQTVALTSHHPAGTCQIGNRDFSVVDNLLRVKNVIGLRVLDASILKTPVSTFPNDILIKLAEHGANLILKTKIS